MKVCSYITFTFWTHKVKASVLIHTHCWEPLFQTISNNRKIHELMAVRAEMLTSVGQRSLVTGRAEWTNVHIQLSRHLWSPVVVSFYLLPSLTLHCIAVSYMLQSEIICWGYQMHMEKEPNNFSDKNTYFRLFTLLLHDIVHTRDNLCFRMALIVCNELVLGKYWWIVTRKG